ncbi:MAG: hypothetical protein ACM31F_04120 [Gemmatimonas sp.]
MGTVGTTDNALSTGDLSAFVQAVAASTTAIARKIRFIVALLSGFDTLKGIWYAMKAPLLRIACETGSVKQSLFRETKRMDPRKLAALARKNAAKSGTTSKIPKGFGKKYDPNTSDYPTDEAAIKKQEESDRFFKEMKKRDF